MRADGGERGQRRDWGGWEGAVREGMIIIKYNDMYACSAVKKLMND